ncbi:hypothetical protein CPB83DRAFT_899849 [Crepidotus variabilis]|uniref:DUF6533 domain-containing protein n=1 Tax=Crepidotus variabilis TaxID=179855 RepID=A0A9P6E424_9AGAR|nr:hypothetical protein CPB83DRAFT_899849 [Crepidotus variabilis]
MASDSSLQLAATKAVRFSIQFASIALIYYDYTLTSMREVAYFWRHRSGLRLSTFLYFCCRYALVANVLYALALAGKVKYIRYVEFNLFELFAIQQYSCDTAYQICTALSVAGRFGILTVWGARTYAVFDKNKIVLICFAALGLTAIILACGLIYIGFVSLFSVGTIVLFNLKGTRGTVFERALNALTIPVSGLMTARFLIRLREWEYLSSSVNLSQSTMAGPIQFRQTETNTETSLT